MSHLAQIQSNSQNEFNINKKSFTNNTNMSKETAIFIGYHSTLYSGNPPRIGKVSTTAIMGPIKKVIYAIKFPESPIEDVSNLVTSAKGTAMHEALTKALLASNQGYTCEKRVEREIESWKISGEFDILTPDKQIKDFKFVSNYNIKKLIEDKSKLQPEWTLEEMYKFVPTYFKYVMQLSIYRYLLNDDEVQPYGSILFSLNNGSDMGKYQIDQEVKFPLRPNEEVHEFLANRIKLIKSYIESDKLPNCTAEEMGYNPPEYKLTRVGTTGKRQTVRGSKFTDYSKFTEFVMQKGKPGDETVTKEATYALCNYCKFKPLCNQH